MRPVHCAAHEPHSIPLLLHDLVQTLAGSRASLDTSDRDPQLTGTLHHAARFKLSLSAAGAGDGVHILTGPIYVCGAEPGDVLQVSGEGAQAVAAQRTTADSVRNCQITTSVTLVVTLNAPCTGCILSSSTDLPKKGDRMVSICHAIIITCCVRENTLQFHFKEIC